jgi:hypothetical protein
MPIHSKDRITIIRLVIILSLIGSFANVALAKPVNDWAKYELLGRVRTLRAERIEYSRLPRKANEVYRCVYAELAFNKKGLLIMSGSYATPADRIFSVADTPLAEGIDFPTGNRVYTYNSRGKLQKMTLREGGEIRGYSTYSYGLDYRKMAIAHQKSNGTVYSSEEFLYDAKGNLTEYTHRGNGDEDFGREQYKYDRKNNLIQRVIYNVGGDDGGAPVKIFFRYNARNKVTEIVERGKGDRLFSRNIFRYDTNGNPISAEHYDSDRTLVSKETYRFKFDSAGNWIWKSTTEWRRLIKEGELTFMGVTVIKRNIKYY